MKRLQLILPDELHTRFKVACTLRGAEMSEIVRGWVEEYVEKEEQEKKKDRISLTKSRK